MTNRANLRRVFWPTMTIFLAVIFFGSAVMAHGGVQQAADHSVVSYFQEPLSTIVREPVTMTFIVRGLDSQPLPNLTVALSVTESLSDATAKDQTIDRRSIQTDANGALTLTKTFLQPHYYDIELAYTAPGADTKDTVGFLLQPTAPRKDWRLAGGLGGAGLILGALLGWLIARKNTVRITANS